MWTVGLLISINPKLTNIQQIGKYLFSIILSNIFFIINIKNIYHTYQSIRLIVALTLLWEGLSPATGPDLIIF